jgi:hypothetical protein
MYLTKSDAVPLRIDDYGAPDCRHSNDPAFSLGFIYAHWFPSGIIFKKQSASPCAYPGTHGIYFISPVGVVLSSDTGGGILSSARIV